MSLAIQCNICHALAHLKNLCLAVYYIKCLPYIIESFFCVCCIATWPQQRGGYWSINEIMIIYITLALYYMEGLGGKKVVLYLAS